MILHVPMPDDDDTVPTVNAIAIDRARMDAGTRIFVSACQIYHDAKTAKLPSAKEGEA